MATKTPQNAKQLCAIFLFIEWKLFLCSPSLFPLSLTHSLCICIIFKTLRWRTVPRSTYLALVRWVAPCAPHALEKHEAARKTSPAQPKISSRFSSCFFFPFCFFFYSFCFCSGSAAASGSASAAACRKSPRPYKL